MTDPSTEPGETLRERKARLTRCAIHEAAVRLSAEHGLDCATVAQIAEAAGVSPRTFFNYFASKEDAVVGVPVGGPDAAAVRASVAAADFSEGPLLETARIIGDLLHQSLGDEETARLRRSLFVRHPQLMQRNTDAGSALTGLLIDELVPILGPRLEDAGLPPGTPHRDGVRMLVLIAFAPLRHAFVTLQRAQPPPETAPEPSAQEVQELFEMSLTLFTSVLEGTRP